MSADPAARARAADVAAGRAPADLVLTGATIADVFGRRTRRADVAIAGERIAAVGDVDHCIDAGTTELHDCSGLIVLPGLLDPHLHVGFSQLSVERLAELLVPRGTAAVSACLSESGAIAGLDAIREQLARAEGTGLDLLASVFHACALFSPQGRFGTQDLLALLRDERCVELREWSDRAQQQLPAEFRALWEEALWRGAAIAGHLEGQTGGELQASVALGVRSDHEATTAEEALERVQLGVTVHMRQGSGARDLLQLLPAITEHGADPDRFAFCSDEQELSDIDANGHIDAKLRMAVAGGIAPLDAVRMATLNAATSMGVEEDHGAIAPGRLASLALVEDLSAFRVARTYGRGRLTSEGGHYRGTIRTSPYPEAWSDTVHVGRSLAASDFALGLPDGAHTVRVIGATENRLANEELAAAVEVVGGRLVADAPAAVPSHTIAKLAVADRHEASGRIGVGLIAGLGIEHGAVAATINAGAFNLMVAGVDEEAMALAANRAIELHGGIVVARDGALVAELALPLFGILSHAPLDDTVPAARAIAAATRDALGSPVEQLVPCLGFACLPAVPALRMTDRGLVRVTPEGGCEIVGLRVG